MPRRPIGVLSFIFIGGGFILISPVWRVLYEAQRKCALVTTGVYAYQRHPQDVGFILVISVTMIASGAFVRTLTIFTAKRHPAAFLK